MTPEQKANELISNAEAVIEQSCNQSSRDAHFFAAKKCATIVCDEVIQSWKRMFGKDEENHPEIVYWKKVKEEIEKA